MAKKVIEIKKAVDITDQLTHLDATNTNWESKPEPTNLVELKKRQVVVEAWLEKYGDSDKESMEDKINDTYTYLDSIIDIIDEAEEVDEVEPEPEPEPEKKVEPAQGAKYKAALEKAMGKKVAPVLSEEGKKEDEKNFAKSMAIAKKNEDLTPAEKTVKDLGHDLENLKTFDMVDGKLVEVNSDEKKPAKKSPKATKRLIQLPKKEEPKEKVVEVEKKVRKRAPKEEVEEEEEVAEVIEGKLIPEDMTGSKYKAARKAEKKAKKAEKKRKRLLAAQAEENEENEPDETPKEKKAPAKKAEHVISRIEAVALIMAELEPEDYDVDEITTASDALFVEQSGKESNIAQQVKYVGFAINFLKTFQA